jgi:FkbM family methyltransferase
MMRKLYTPARWAHKQLLRQLGFFNWETMEASGETWFLHDMLPGLLRTRQPLVMDVGGNSGDYTLAVLKRFPEARAHAFEPHPVTFQKLVVAIDAKASCHQMALGSQPGTLNLYDSEGSTEGGIRASLSPEALKTMTSKPLVAVPVEVSTLDLFLGAQGIEKVDFLKIDTEGFEMDVLNGASKALASGRIGVIQFEFNALHIGRRQFLIDFMERLPGHRLYRLLADGMVALDKLKPYEREIFAFQNIVAIRRDIAPETT